MERAMVKEDAPRRPAFPASEPERAAIRALKHWLLASPCESPFADQIVRLRVAAEIARLSEALDPRAAREACRSDA